MTLSRRDGIDAWLRTIGAMGWRGATAEAAAAEAGVTAEELLRLAGDRLDAVAAFQDRVAEEAALGAASAAGSVRERLFDGLMQGFDALQADRAGALAIWRSRDPGVALLLAGRGGVHARRLLTAAGSGADGLRGQLRAAALLALCVQAFRSWAADDSADMAATMAELDRLLERAERAETEGLSPDLVGLPGLSALVSRLPLPGRRASADPAHPPSADPPGE